MSVCTTVYVYMCVSFPYKLLIKYYLIANDDDDLNCFDDDEDNDDT